MELCYRALMCRHERLKGTLSDAAPILWQYGALARLPKGEPIDKLLYGGYSTISLGYAGLYECVKYMTGKSHTDPEATPFALEVMDALRRLRTDFVYEWIGDGELRKQVEEAILAVLTLNKMRQVATGRRPVKLRQAWVWQV
jgi:hypothetical protein